MTARRSETAEVYAEPGGGFSAEITAVPTRVHRADGSWTAVDTTLRQFGDGSLQATATVADVRFSGGGTGPLATFTTDGNALTYSWPSALPTPVVSGDSASYPEVYPGVDLWVKATVDGFRYYLVVKSRAAAANPKLRSQRLALSGQGLTIVPTAGGGFEARDSAGRPALRAGGAAMWDAAGRAPAARTSAHDVAGLLVEAPEGSAEAKANVDATPTSLTVTPDAAMLADPATVYPVVIDPATALPANTVGYADSTNVNRDDGVSRAGKNPDGSGIYRSFFYFSSGTSIGSAAATVTDANFSITMTHSWACYDTPVNAYSVGGFSSGRNAWPGPAVLSDGWLGERKGHAHKPSSGGEECSDDPQPDQVIVFDDARVASRVQYNHDQGWSSFAVALMAAQNGGGGESTTEWWKKFNPGSARLYIAWNQVPTAPTSLFLKAAGVTDCSGSSASLTNDSTPLLCVTPHDADGGVNTVVIEIYKPDKVTLVASSGTTVTNRTVETAAPWIAPTLADGAYTVKARSCDAYKCGPDSSWGAFTVDTIAPATPAIAAVSGGTVTYKSISTGEWLGGIGQAGKFTLTSAADAAAIRYAFNGVVAKDASNNEWFATTGGALSVTLTPSKDGVNRITAEARDAAGNSLGMGAPFDFLVKPAAQKSWTWELNGATNSVASSGTIDPYPLSGGSWTPVYVAGQSTQAIQLPGSQSAATSGPVIETMSSFTVVARVKLGTISPASPMTIVSQDGGAGSAFRLQYRTDLDAPAWCFTMFTAANTADTASTRSCAPALDTGTATTTNWVDIAGAYDSTAHTIQFFILLDGVAEPVTPPTVFTSAWSATGPLAIGRARQNNAATEYLTGAVDRVAVINRALSAADLTTEMKKA
ncbi:LamG-like jellyroll fold domain-containing protein [Dactylosporangium sp. NPDC049140]|uniref:LamG-like jellyroll fold domain-containing protein n=1 Tax=Dactylosporangium sp. NPDC049140 TaxID=3155647 RepID=UPI0033FEC961